MTHSQGASGFGVKDLWEKKKTEHIDKVHQGFGLNQWETNQRHIAETFVHGWRLLVKQLGGKKT
jgi:hypothetical protein